MNASAIKLPNDGGGNSAPADFVASVREISVDALDRLASALERILPVAMSTRLLRTPAGKYVVTPLAVAAVAALSARLVARGARMVARSAIPPPHMRHLPRVGPMTWLGLILRRPAYLDMHAAIQEHLIADARRRGIQLGRGPSGKPVPPTTSCQWLFGYWMIYCAEPKDIKMILTKNEIFEKGQAENLGFEDEFGGKNVAGVTTTDWKRQRKVINPAFRHGWDPAPFGAIGHTLLAELDKAVARGPVDPEPWMQRATLDALSDSIFGFPLGSLRDEKSPTVALYNRVMASVSEFLPILTPKWLRPFVPACRRQKALIKQFDNWIFGMIDEKKRILAASTKGKQSALRDEAEDEAGKRDLLQLMIEAAAHHEFSREDLRANTVVFFFAGHATTALTLTFVIYLLGLHPEIQDKVRHQVLGALGLSTKDEPPLPVRAHEILVPDKKALSQSPYLSYVIKEAMRLYPNVTQIPFRKATRDMMLENMTRVPAGSLIAIDVLMAHRSEANWGADADKFRPERWAEEAKKHLEEAGQHEKGSGGSSAGEPSYADVVASSGTGADEPVLFSPSAHDYRWLPFGGGPRVCLGQQFSLLEQQVMLSMLLQRYTWRVVGNERALNGTPDTLATSLLQPQGIQVQFTRRDGKQQ